VTDELRKMAQAIREENERRKADKRVKCAQVLTAAAGLGILSKKLKGFGHGA
jgi:hypothetical protein